MLGATFPSDLGEQPEEQQHTDEMDWPGLAKHKKSLRNRIGCKDQQHTQPSSVSLLKLASMLILHKGLSRGELALQSGTYTTG